MLIFSSFQTNLTEAVLSQCDKALVAWKTIPESHGEQSLHGSNNEGGVCGIMIPLFFHLPLLMVELSVEKPQR